MRNRSIRRPNVGRSKAKWITKEDKSEGKIQKSGGERGEGDTHGVGFDYRCTKKAK